jgi:hypothetical protein
MIIDKPNNHINILLLGWAERSIEDEITLTIDILALAFWAIAPAWSYSGSHSQSIVLA